MRLHGVGKATTVSTTASKLSNAHLNTHSPSLPSSPRAFLRARHPPDMAPHLYHSAIHYYALYSPFFTPLLIAVTLPLTARAARAVRRSPLSFPYLWREVERGRE